MNDKPPIPINIRPVIADGRLGKLSIPSQRKPQEGFKISDYAEAEIIRGGVKI